MIKKLDNLILNFTQNKSKLLKYCFVIVFAIIFIINAFFTAFNLIFLKPKDCNISDFTLVNTEYVNEETIITITDDSQLIYDKSSPILNLYFIPDTLFNVGEWVLFYQDDVNSEFSADKKLHAKKDGDYYYFSLPINTEKIRFDLGVTASNTITFEKLTLNHRDFSSILSFDTKEVFNIFVLPIILYCSTLFISEIYLKIKPILLKQR